MPHSLQDRRSVLITGCSSGIGLATAHGLKNRGYHVFATARQKEDVSQLTREGFNAFQLDYCNSDSIANCVHDVQAVTGGTLYALFNNGAYGQPGAIEDLSRKALRDQFETNLFGVHELTCQVIPIMRKQGGGRIIQNSSILGFAPMRFRGAYNASKFALEGLSDTLRMELHGTHIHVSLIQPGPIESRFRANALLKFREHIDASKSPHKDHYQKVLARLTSETNNDPFLQQPSAVLKRVIHALESQRPHIRYPVTFPTYLFSGLQRLLPPSWFFHLLRKVG